MAFTPQFTPLSTFYQSAGRAPPVISIVIISGGVFLLGRYQGSAADGRAFRKEWEPLAVMRYYRRTGRSQPGRGYDEKVFQGRYRTAGPVFFRENFRNRKVNFHIYQGRQWVACVPGRGFIAALLIWLSGS